MGTQDFCLMEKIDAPAMPFDHQLGLKSGLAAVDAAIDERLAQFKGVPLARVLKVSRRSRTARRSRAPRRSS